MTNIFVNIHHKKQQKLEKFFPIISVHKDIMHMISDYHLDVHELMMHIISSIQHDSIK